MNESDNKDSIDKNSASYRLAMADYYAKLQTIHLQAQIDYGKWIIASLLVVNSGGLLSLFNSTRASLYVSSYAHWWLLIGASLALLSGLLGWMNWSANSDACDLSRDAWLEDAPQDYDLLWSTKSMITSWTYNLAIAAAFCSFCCIFGAVWRLQTVI